MSERKPSAPRATATYDLETRRRETLAQLESLHGTRSIGAEEYRRRAEVARRARDEAELESVSPSPLDGAQPLPAARPAPATAAPAPSLDSSFDPSQDAELDPGADPGVDRAPGSERPSVPTGEETGYAIAVMGGSTRKGPWEPPERLYVVAFMGGVDLDFRQAALLEGVTEVNVLALMGGAKIVVPEDVDVEVHGFGFMGGFDHVSHHGPGEGRPLIRIRGLALMGGVEIKVKPLPGASKMDRLKQRVRDLV